MIEIWYQPKLDRIITRQLHKEPGKSFFQIFWADECENLGPPYKRRLPIWDSQTKMKNAGWYRVGNL